MLFCLLAQTFWGSVYWSLIVFFSFFPLSPGWISRSHRCDVTRWRHLAACINVCLEMTSGCARVSQGLLGSVLRLVTFTFTIVTLVICLVGVKLTLLPEFVIGQTHRCKFSCFVIDRAKSNSHQPVVMFLNNMSMLIPSKYFYHIGLKFYLCPVRVK